MFFFVRWAAKPIRNLGEFAVPNDESRDDPPKGQPDDNDKWVSLPGTLFRVRPSDYAYVMEAATSSSGEGK